MASRRHFLKIFGLSASSLPLSAQPKFELFKVSKSNSPEAWFKLLHKIAKPVMENQAKETLVFQMPVEGKNAEAAKSRALLSPLEAFARTSLGLSGFLNADFKQYPILFEAQKQYITWFISGFEKAVNPQAEGYLFKQSSSPQTLVEVAFLTLFFQKCPQLLPVGEALTHWEIARNQGLKHEPYPNNWLLFSALTLLNPPNRLASEEELEKANAYLSQFLALYAGDGWYKDGPEFHLDYYNSFVIHPFLLAIYDKAVNYPALSKIKGFDKIVPRAARFAVQLEKLISIDGFMPAIGRSCTYRSGILHHLSLVSSLPKAHPIWAYLPMGFAQQANTAIWQATQAFFQAKETFDSKGWLRPGMYGFQPNLCEVYISTGSLYLATSAFLPLNLINPDFWQSGTEETSTQKLLKGLNLKNDEAYKE